METRVITSYCGDVYEVKTDGERKYFRHIKKVSNPNWTPFSVPMSDSEIIASLQATNAKMRQALERIAAIENRHHGGDWDEIEEAREIARQALKETE